MEGWEPGSLWKAGLGTGKSVCAKQAQGREEETPEEHLSRNLLRLHLSNVQCMGFCENDGDRIVYSV